MSFGILRLSMVVLDFRLQKNPQIWHGVDTVKYAMESRSLTGIFQGSLAWN
jgi:hypothetical protein